MALKSSLLDTTIQGARGILLNISGGKDLTLHEITEVAEAVAAAAEPDATLIFGAVVNESLNDNLCVTLVAAGFDSTSEETLTAQVEGKIVRPVEKRQEEPRPAEPRIREYEPRQSEPRSTERRSSDTDFGNSTSGWDKPREPRSTPRTEQRRRRAGCAYLLKVARAAAGVRSRGRSSRLGRGRGRRRERQGSSTPPNRKTRVQPRVCANSVAAATRPRATPRRRWPAVTTRSCISQTGEAVQVLRRREARTCPPDTRPRRPPRTGGLAIAVWWPHKC